MDNRDFSNLGEQIRGSVQDAIDSMDFKQLNRTISDTVNFALDEARRQMMKGMGMPDSGPDGASQNAFGETGSGMGSGSQAGSWSGMGTGSRAGAGSRSGSAAGSEWRAGADRRTGSRTGAGSERRAGGRTENGSGGNGRRYGSAAGDSPGYRAFQTSGTPGWTGVSYRRGTDAKQPLAVRFNQPGRITAILFTVFGGIGLGLVGILFLVMWLVVLISKPVWGAVLGSTAILLALGGVFGTMLGTGISARGRLKRAGLYLKQAGSRLYCDVEELARSIGKSKKYVIRDLQKMIEKGILPEAHIDEQKTCLMLNEETYQQYLSAQKALKQREREQALLEEQEKKGKKVQMAADRPKEEESAMPAGLEEMMAQGREQLRILREANDAIPGEVISEKISRLETVIRRIFETVERHPEQMEEMERFMEYYLPTTVKLVTAYRDFDQVEIEGDNIVSAKHEIEETLDTINTAFERLLDDLFQDAAIDISTDASVLQTMLKKDGFAADDFSRREER